MQATIQKNDQCRQLIIQQLIKRKFNFINEPRIWKILNNTEKFKYSLLQDYVRKQIIRILFPLILNPNLNNYSIILMTISQTPVYPNPNIIYNMIKRVE